MTAISQQQTPLNYKNMFIASIYMVNFATFFYGCRFFSSAAIIFTEKSGNALFFSVPGHQK